MIDYRRIGLWILIALTIVGVYVTMRAVESGRITRPTTIETTAPVAPDASLGVTPSASSTVPGELRQTPSADSSSTP